MYLLKKNLTTQSKRSHCFLPDYIPYVFKLGLCKFFAVHVTENVHALSALDLPYSSKNVDHFCIK